LQAQVLKHIVADLIGVLPWAAQGPIRRGEENWCGCGSHGEELARKKARSQHLKTLICI